MGRVMGPSSFPAGNSFSPLASEPSCPAAPPSGPAANPATDDPPTTYQRLARPALVFPFYGSF